MRRLEPFYYLRNFQTVLDWLHVHYGDLLAVSEQQFIRDFATLPIHSQALLVRLIMRKGALFRSSRIAYAEIESIAEAAAPLIELRWLDAMPLLSIDQLFHLLKKAELERVFGICGKRGLAKAAMLELLREAHPSLQCFDVWTGCTDEFAYLVNVTQLCEQLRLIFFGNFRQDWSEFVLADLGIFRYEQVELTQSSRAFQTRADIDAFLHLYGCRQRLSSDELPGDVLPDIPVTPLTNEWLESRRNKLLLQIAQRYEQRGDLSNAYVVYARCRYSGARLRAIRMLERMSCYAEAYASALYAQQHPESEAERQRLGRVLQRLHRCLGLPRVQLPRLAAAPRLDLMLPAEIASIRVERRVQEHLSAPQAPVRYVENGLINSLFGLLCWDAIFAPLPGAFFHGFHSAPADLSAPDFHRRRQLLFSQCIAQLATREYIGTITRNYVCKQNIQTPFVAWGLLDDELINLSLQCIPAAHLRCFFERLLLDLNENRTGLPDLIQFWPDELRYRMIEVKAPGDRLQDNQRRWIDYCTTHDIPVAVCHVQWLDAAA